MFAAACANNPATEAQTPVESDNLLIWTLENETARVTIQQGIMQRFEQASGMNVELVALDEDEVSQVLAASVAAGNTPDAIIAVGLDGLKNLAADNLVNVAISEQVVNDLGQDTFAEQALRLTQSPTGEQLGVPSDGWAQLLLYRTDLFAEAGLAPPTSFEAILTAAQTLNRPGMAGIVAATEQGAFTQQTFEHLALANGCDFIGADGEIALDSPECIEVFDFYRTLIRDYSVPGAQDVVSTRATYFAGQAAMIIWSSFILDELAGLRNDVLPTCPECTANPTFLAENTGIVSTIEGFHGDRANFGEVTSLVPMVGANPRVAEFLEFMMTDGYVDWLGVSPEGKIPVRPGNGSDPNYFANAWAAMDTGVDSRAPLRDFYSAETIDAILDALNTFDRWGIPQGQGDFYGAMVGQNIVSRQIGEMVNAGRTAHDAALTAQSDSEVLRLELGG